MTNIPAAGRGYPPARSPVQLRPFGTGELLSAAFTLVRQNPTATIGLTAAGTAVGAVLAIIVVVTTRGATSAAVTSNLSSFVLGSAIVAVSGGVITALGEGMFGRRICARTALRRGRTGWILLAWLTCSVIIALVWAVPLLALSGFGVLLSLPAWIWLGVMLSLTFPVVVLERRNPFAALGRSWRLVYGSYWRIFGRFLLMIIVVAVLFVISALFVSAVTGLGITLLRAHGKLPGNPGLLWLITITVFTLALVALVAPIWLAFICLLYTDVRMRREGLDLMLRLPSWSAGQPGTEFLATLPAPPAAPPPGPWPAA
jgi:hypothetical protein